MMGDFFLRPGPVPRGIFLKAGTSPMGELSFRLGPVIFLSKKQARDLVKNLLTDEISVDDFTEFKSSTENGRLVQGLVSRLAGAWPDQLSTASFLGALPSIQVSQATCESCLMSHWCIFIYSVRNNLTFDLLRTETSSN
jgi:hypothetical protein